MVLLGLVLFSVKLFASQDNQDGTIIECTGRYALCITSDCPKAPSNSSIAVCNCPVYVGKNWGTNSCAERLAATEGEVYSEYSPRYLLSADGTTPAAKKILDPSSFCNTPSNTSSQYANCLNVLCTLTDGKNAACPCPVITRTANDPGYFIETDDCEKASVICNEFSSSSSEIAINSAPVAFSTIIVNTSLASYGETGSASMFCGSKKNDINDTVSSTVKANKKASIKNTLDTFVDDNQNDDPNEIGQAQSLDIHVMKDGLKK